MFGAHREPLWHVMQRHCQRHHKSEPQQLRGPKLLAGRRPKGCCPDHQQSTCAEPCPVAQGSNGSTSSGETSPHIILLITHSFQPERAKGVAATSQVFLPSLPGLTLSTRDMSVPYTSHLTTPIPVTVIIASPSLFLVLTVQRNMFLGALLLRYSNIKAALITANGGARNMHDRCCDYGVE